MCLTSMHANVIDRSLFRFLKCTDMENQLQLFHFKIILPIFRKYLTIFFIYDVSFTDLN